MLRMFKNPVFLFILALCAFNLFLWLTFGLFFYAERYFTFRYSSELMYVVSNLLILAAIFLIPIVAGYGLASVFARFKNESEMAGMCIISGLINFLILIPIADGILLPLIFVSLVFTAAWGGSVFAAIKN